MCQPTAEQRRLASSATSTTLRYSALPLHLPRPERIELIVELLPLEFYHNRSDINF
jgi:hypothetical protein